MSSGPKYHGIELLRFAMALIVVIYHISAWICPLQSPLLSAIVHYGQPVAVPVFWCLSGFIFYAVYGETIHSLRVNFRGFALARFTRLYPLALVTLILCLLLNELYFSINHSSFVYHRGDFYHFCLNLLMMSHWGFQKFTAFNGPVWSVSVEVITYFVFFVVARLFGSSPLIAILAVFLGKGIAHFEPNLTNHLAISSCIQLFFLGGLVYSISSRFDRVLDRHYFIACAVSSISLLLVTSLLSDRYRIQLLPPSLVLWSTVLARNAAGWMEQVADFCGSLTYSSYLLHFPVVLLVVIILDKLQIQRSIITGSVGIALVVALILLLSRLTFVYFESPIQYLLRCKLSDRRAS